MSETITNEQLDKARVLAEQAQDTNISVLLICMQGNEKAKRVKRKTQRRAERRLHAWSEMLYEWASGRKP